MNPTQPESVDLLVHAGHVLPILPLGQLYRDCTIAVNQGRIVGLCPRSEAAQRFHAKTTHDLSDHVVMPGLINAHGHAAMSLFKVSRIRISILRLHPGHPVLRISTMVMSSCCTAPAPKVASEPSSSDANSGSGR